MSRLVAVYPSRLVVRPGDGISFHAHADTPLDCAIDCVRIVQEIDRKIDGQSRDILHLKDAAQTHGIVSQC